MSKPLPTDRTARQAIASEAATADKDTAVRFAAVRALEVVGRQAVDPVFRGSAAQKHLADEFARLRAILSEPPPSLVLCGPHLMLPDPALPAAEYLQALRRELIRLQREALADPPDPSKAERELAAELRRQSRAIPAALVEHMIGRDSSPVDRVAQNVHGNPEISDRAIGLNCDRVNEVAESLKLSLHYSCHGGSVFKDRR